MKLNLGCGTNKIKGCVNIDLEKSCNPEVICDFTKQLPFSDNSVDEIYLFHVVEHIPEIKIPILLQEIRRILKDTGKFLVSYPEFIKCAQNYISNKQGKRDFWKATIYGRQLYSTDYHVTLMDTNIFKTVLHDFGFKPIVVDSEPGEDYNTFILAEKATVPTSYEELLKRTMF
jgi:predicted SAM-dependent methyltransferase